MADPGDLRLKLVLLGGFRASRASGTSVLLPTRKAEALLGYLALHPGQASPRDKLIGLLWGDRDGEHSRNSLRQTLFVLRQALGPEWPRILDIKTGSVGLNPSTVGVDVRTFEALAREENPPALQQAVDLYRGDLLDGFHVNEAAFEDWLVTEQERLRELALDVHAKLLRYQCSARQTGSAILTARRLLAVDPLQETTHRTLMRLLADAGRAEAALRQYDTLVGLLREELGLEPQKETRDLYEEIKQGRTRRAAGVDAGVPARVSGAVAGDGAVPERVIERALQRERGGPRVPSARAPFEAEVEKAQRLRRRSAESRAQAEKLELSTWKNVRLSMRLLVDSLRIVGGLQ